MVLYGHPAEIQGAQRICLSIILGVSTKLWLYDINIYTGLGKVILLSWVVACPIRGTKRKEKQRKEESSWSWSSTLGIVGLELGTC